MPRWASSSASPSPTGPPPTISTGIGSRAAPSMLGGLARRLRRLHRSVRLALECRHHATKLRDDLQSHVPAQPAAVIDPAIELPELALAERLGKSHRLTGLIEAE